MSAASDPQLVSLLNSIISRLDNIEGKLNSPATTSGDVANLAGEEPSEGSPAVAAYEADVLSAQLTPLLNTINSIHKDGLKLTEAMKVAFEGIKDIIYAASVSKKPSGDLSAAILPKLKPVQDSMGKIRKLRLPRELDLNQRSVEEMMACLSWVVVEKTPVPFVKDTVGAAEYYSNKLRREFKNSKKDVAKHQISFCDQLKSLILALADYIKAFHLTGLTFNPKGGEFSAAPTAGVSTEKAQTQAPAAAPSSGGAAGGINAIMSELKTKQTSAGDSAATGLRKVTKDMQTWRKEYDGGSKPAVSSSAVKSAPKPAAPKKPAAAKPPVCKFVDIGSKWIVEYQTKEQNTGAFNIVKIDINEPRNQVYIFKCENITIDIKGKCKGIVVDNCKRVNVLFDDIISVVELVNNKNVAIQTRGVVPNVSIDKTSGCMVYLSKASASVTSFVTSTSSEMNVSWPVGDKDDELVEKPIPEQFLHKLVDGSITSEVSELYA